MAHLIDMAPVFGLVAYAFFSLLAGGPDRRFGNSGGVLFLTAMTVALAGVQVFLLATRAQTVGKIIFKIRIVDHATGAHPGFARVVLMRSVLPLFINSACNLFGLFSLFGLVDPCFIFGAEKRCLHDLMAGTSVVQAEQRVDIDARVFE